MAQLIKAQSQVKPLFNGDGMLIGFEPRDQSIISLRSHKRKIKFSRNSSTRLFASSSSSVSSSESFKFKQPVSSDKSCYDIGYELFYDDPEYVRDDLSCFRGLVLDISYRPINVVCWKRAICLEFMEKADVLEYYDRAVNSPSGSFYIPAVLRVPHLLQVVRRRRIKSTLSRKNILARDSFTCQYCSTTENLTIDHVIPIALGGEWTWENLVTACSRCNSRKGQKTLEEANMKLNKVPKAPKDYNIVAIPLTNSAVQMLKMRKGTPEEWQEYLA
ncbi:HNHc domain-containing protein [Heracleum sosnowskyi]|uniref:HNHc domain-containing protein n=1 Tax=Heracleum sosnowskyi TaxID=360622 RepID=A0AAD8HHD6_9APIA|nr:HNHc domain-containing protein [Heracleum sosnowskyi]